MVMIFAAATLNHHQTQVAQLLIHLLRFQVVNQPAIHQPT